VRNLKINNLATVWMKD